MEDGPDPFGGELGPLPRCRCRGLTPKGGFGRSGGPGWVPGGGGANALTPGLLIGGGGRGGPSRSGSPGRGPGGGGTNTLTPGRWVAAGGWVPPPWGVSGARARGTAEVGLPGAASGAGVTGGGTGIGPLETAPVLKATGRTTAGGAPVHLDVVAGGAGCGDPSPAFESSQVGCGMRGLWWRIGAVDGLGTGVDALVGLRPVRAADCAG